MACCNFFVNRCRRCCWGCGCNSCCNNCACNNGNGCGCGCINTSTLDTASVLDSVNGCGCGCNTL